MKVADWTGHDHPMEPCNGMCPPLTYKEVPVTDTKNIHVLNAVRPNDINLVKHLLDKHLLDHRDRSNPNATCPCGQTNTGILLSFEELDTLMKDMERTWQRLSTD